jgi:hypothetical protein
MGLRYDFPAQQRTGRLSHTSDETDRPWSHDLVAEESRLALSERAVGLVARFARHSAQINWFSRLGEPLSREDARIARLYLSGLGFPHVMIARVEDFDAAAIAAETLDRDAPGFETEEQLRAELTLTAYERLDPELLEAALLEVQGFVGAASLAAIEELGAIHGVEDEPLLHAAAGAAVQATHLSALVLAAGVDDHPFVEKFRLFELGRWPVALIGTTLHLF